MSNVRVDREGVSVMRFSDGMVAVTAHKVGLHLRPHEARALAEILARLILEQGEPT